MTPTNTTATERQMILAMQSLDHRIQTLEATLAQKRKIWADRIGEATKILHELIRDSVPTDAEDCLSRLDEIQRADQTRQDLESEKRTDIEDKKRDIAQATSAFYEILRRRTNPHQMNMNFGAQDSDFDPRAGIILSAAHMAEVRKAAESLRQHSDDQVDGMDDLMNRLDELGVAGLEFPDPLDDDDGIDGDHPDPPSDGG